MKNLLYLSCLFILFSMFLPVSDSIAENKNYVKFDSYVKDVFQKPVEDATIKIFKGEIYNKELIKELTTDEYGHFEMIVDEKLEDIFVEISKDNYRETGFYGSLKVNTIALQRAVKDYSPESKKEFENWSTSNIGWKNNVKERFILRRDINQVDYNMLTRLVGEELQVALTEIVLSDYFSADDSNFKELFFIEDQIKDDLKVILSKEDVAEKELLNLIANPELVTGGQNSGLKVMTLNVEAKTSIDVVINEVKRKLNPLNGEIIEEVRIANRNEDKVLTEFAVNPRVGECNPYYRMLLHKIHEAWAVIKLLKGKLCID